MEKMFMSSGVIVSIILILMGCLKLPIKKFKGRKWYSPLLTLVTLLLTFGVCTLCQLFILEKPFVSVDFVILLTTTIAGVMVSYNGVYEGLNLKGYVHNLIAKWGELKKLSPEAKAVKEIDKVVSKLGLTTETFGQVISQVTVKSPVVKEEEKSDK